MTSRPGRARRPADRVLPAPVRDWAYFFDIDGTLVDLGPSPDAVSLDHGLRRLIARLHQAAGGAVALISGRGLSDIDRLFPEVRLPAAGQHGIERRTYEGHVSRHAFPSDELARARAELALAVGDHPGLLLEDKGLSLALHYGQAPHLGAVAHRVVRALVAHSTLYCVQSGKGVVEMKPAGRDKGMAVLEFMDEEPFRGRVPVFVGDDLTDEFGFSAVNRLRGYAVKVGPGETVARFRLRDVRAVRGWLERGVDNGSAGDP
jgi:trehalose 6-phosphate phosphatase